MWPGSGPTLGPSGCDAGPFAPAPNDAADGAILESLASFDSFDFLGFFGAAGPVPGSFAPCNAVGPADATGFVDPRGAAGPADTVGFGDPGGPAGPAGPAGAGRAGPAGLGATLKESND